MDDHLKMRNSLTGHHSVGLTEILLFAFLRRNAGVQRPDDIDNLSDPPFHFPHIKRLLTYFYDRYSAGFAPMDKKEEQMLAEVNQFLSSKELLEATYKNNLDKCKEILEANPLAINSFDAKFFNRSVLHIAGHF